MPTQARKRNRRRRKPTCSGCRDYLNWYARIKKYRPGFASASPERQRAIVAKLAGFGYSASSLATLLNVERGCILGIAHRSRGRGNGPRVYLRGDRAQNKLLNTWVRTWPDLSGSYLAPKKK